MQLESVPIHIFDTTLRDGEQSPGCSMQPSEKLRLAHQLAALKVSAIEAGFPVASQDDFAGVQMVAREVREPVIAALCRTIPADIDRAWEAIRDAARPRIHTFIATSDIHMLHKLKKNRGEVLAMARDAVRRAKDCTPDVEFSAEDATRSDLAFLSEIVAAALAEGATVDQHPGHGGLRRPGRAGRDAEGACAGGCRPWTRPS